MIARLAAAAAVTLVLYFRNSIKFNLLLFRLFLDIIYADNSWDLLVRGTHMCIVSVSLLPCVYVFCAVLCFLHGVLTNDVLQISLNAAKMVLVMKRQIQHVVALFSPFTTSRSYTHWSSRATPRWFHIDFTTHALNLQRYDDYDDDDTNTTSNLHLS